MHLVNLLLNLLKVLAHGLPCSGGVALCDPRQDGLVGSD